MINMKSSKFIHTLIILFLSILTFIAVYPLIWMLISAFKTETDFLVNRFGLPKNWIITNITGAWGRGNFDIFFRNSFLVSIMSLFIMIGTASMTAYAFTRYRVRFHSKILFYFIIGQMLSAQIVLIAVYLVLIFLNLNDSLFGLSLVYVASGLPFAVFLLYGFFKGLPYELYEAAEIDGHNEIGIFLTIAIPLAKPGLATAFIIQFMYVWNEFPLALIALSSPQNITLPVGVFRVVQDMYSTNHTMASAGLAITAMPIIIFYAVFQRRIISGITAGAIKG
jgi:ABC-type glycerol-3-phosphate transport system permease component